jgi:capsular polysaccharide biosynthesis protein
MLKQNKNDGIENDEIDLMELFFEILGHWKMIILSTILVAAMTFVYSKYCITPQYESTSELYVLSKSTSITSLADINLGSKLTSDYIVVLTGRPVLDQVIENLDLKMSYKGLAGKVTISNPTDSRILEITVRDSDPNRAKLIADEIAEVSSGFIAEKMDQDPPSIIQYGYADGGKVSPSIRKNTMMGALFGAVIAIAFVIIIFLLNDTIVGQDDVEKKLGMNLLGSLPLEESNNDLNDKKDRKKRKKG